jgi:pimeloyl-ACP methyl ester carboxylesterase
MPSTQQDFVWGRKTMEARDSIPDKIVLNIHGFRFTALAEGPENGELVLFLHGFPQFADAWADLMSLVARAGFRALAVDQRGYSSEARPREVTEYAIEKLISDIRAFADAVGRQRFHIVGHDWGGLLAWEFAAKHPSCLLSLCALSTPHPDAFFNALDVDEDQKQRSKYIALFQMPGGVAETLLQADDDYRLRGAYQGKVPETAIDENIRRLAEPFALTSALNWYRALDPQRRIGKITVPTLYVWGSMDMWLGEFAAIGTEDHVTGPYRFEKLEGKSHWLLDEAPNQISAFVLEHLCANVP